MKRSIAFISLVAAVSAWGCSGSDSSIDPGSPDAGAAGNTGSAGTSSTEDGASPCTQASDTDDPDPEGADDNCDGADGVVGKDVYIDGTTGADTNLGTPDAPLRSIEAAIALSQKRGGRVLIAKGDFTIDVIDAEGDYTLHGGYPAGFFGPRKRELTILRATTPHGVLVEGAGSVRVETLSIQGVDATEDEQRTSQALRIDVVDMTLVDVVVRSGNARPGQALGPAGESGTPGLDGKSRYATTNLECNGVLQPSYSGGAAEKSYNSAGGSPGNCTTKTPATPGKPGIAGTHGANASKSPALADGVVSWNDGAQGHDDAQPGFGGAGGGACNVAFAGGGGTGGCPGRPGAGGSSGGGSVAIVVSSGSLKLEGCLITTGYAGNGGNGTKGGAGGPGGIGGPPWCNTLYVSDCTKQPVVCTSSTDPYGFNCAAWGAKGGVGGLGGHGGGGVGGWTIGVVTTGSAAAEVDPSTIFELGVPGKGGEAGDNLRAPDGEKRKSFHIDAEVPPAP